MERTPVNHVGWSVPFGFDQATLVSSPTHWLVCSGQTALDAEGKVTHVGDMRAQTDAALASIEALLAEAGMTMDDIVRTTAYVTDVDAFLAHPEAAWPRAAFTLIGVSRLAYPELMVELEVIAAR
jgi:enamine deaminase RidA (YjgF/YER057c/UK114 family)